VATCWNLLETADTLSYESLLPLLLEEYSPGEIEKFRPNIDECIESVNAALRFRDLVLAAYREVGISLREDKAGCMRALSKRFERGQMKRVYTVLDRMV
jgi:hypothetical protein